jgi:hypothetical protein
MPDTAQAQGRKGRRDAKQHWHSKQLFAAAPWHRGQDTIDTDVHVYFTTLMHILCI